jgi:hypothetical protein
MKTVFIVVIFISGRLAAQNNIAHFSFWKPRTAQEQNFEEGYKKHLTWHKDNGDKWSWYGWYFISGPRAGQFFDATFDHSWTEFDKAVNPAGDRADNALHTEPFADFIEGMKMMKLSHLSIENANGLKTRLLRYITINISDVAQAEKVIDKLKRSYQSAGITSFYTFQPVDGVSLNHYIIFIGAKTWEEFGKTSNLQEKISAIENELKIKCISNVLSETLVYREDMSLFPSSQ